MTNNEAPEGTVRTRVTKNGEPIYDDVRVFPVGEALAEMTTPLQFGRNSYVITVTFDPPVVPDLAR